MNSPGSARELPSDGIRTTAAAIVVALTLGGWAALAVRHDLRAGLTAQGGVWWIEQALLLLQAVACIGVMFDRRFVLAPAWWLTLAVVAFAVVIWLQAIGRGHVALQITTIVQIVLLWRLAHLRPWARGTFRAPAV